MGVGGCQNDLQLALRHHLVGDAFLSNWTEDRCCLGDEGACVEDPITRPTPHREKKIKKILESLKCSCRTREDAE